MRLTFRTRSENTGLNSGDGGRDRRRGHERRGLGGVLAPERRSPVFHPPGAAEMPLGRHGGHPGRVSRPGGSDRTPGMSRPKFHPVPRAHRRFAGESGLQAQFSPPLLRPLGPTIPQRTLIRPLLPSWMLRNTSRLLSPLPGRTWFTNIYPFDVTADACTKTQPARPIPARDSMVAPGEVDLSPKL